MIDAGLRCGFKAGVSASILCIGSGLAFAQAIQIDKKASQREAFAARELDRYVYLRTGTLLTIQSQSSRGGFVIVRKGSKLLDELKLTEKQRREIASLRSENYLLSNIGGDRFMIAGGDETGVLYGVYRYAEKLGIRFYLHGDVIPDRRIPLSIPTLHELGRPLFALRGINPFHDFPEGPDWWNRDDYLAVIGQLPKLRMNFFGLHTYPEGGAGPEPEVWIGRQSDISPDGKVNLSYPSTWASTPRQGGWGYDAEPTSRFSCGASQYFAEDEYGPSVMKGMMPMPKSEAESNKLFNAAGSMLRDAFAEANSLGVKTCVGTETPLTIPKLVQDRLRAEGKDPGNPAVVQSIYSGIFQRLNRMSPVDYYWLWTPEDWTWNGNTPEQLKKTTNDFESALGALKSLGNPIKLATCGWVLGPQNDRSALDRVLPKNVAVSAINQSVGNSPVEPGFGKVLGRSKWAIPWMENDPALTALQLWAGRMLYDAADAKRLGCDGLFGIHWRTKILAPNVSALASAAWDQSWKPIGFDKAASDLTLVHKPESGAIGGETAQFTNPVSGTDEQAVYQTVRYNMDGYDIKVPNGTYTVTLKFNEPYYSQPGKRVFGVQVQGRAVVDRLDIFERIGQNHAIDFTTTGVVVKNGVLQVRFTKVIEFPCIAGIVVSGSNFTRKINCGGSKIGDYVGEKETGSKTDPQNRTAPTAWFFEDFARANFGNNLAKDAGSIFVKVDGTNLPKPASWITGPGDIVSNPIPWATVGASYSFVDALARLRSRVVGSGNLERFDYWLNTFKYMREMGRLGCLRGQLDAIVASLDQTADGQAKSQAAEKGLAVRLEMARAWERMLGYFEATVSTPGELGTLSNLEQHVKLRAHFLDIHDDALVKALGHDLPAGIKPSDNYQGLPRIVVPTVRTAVARNEAAVLQVILASSSAHRDGFMMWRPIGAEKYVRAPLRHVGRSVYQVSLPAIPPSSIGIEYYIECVFDVNGKAVTLRSPATGPNFGQTVIAN